MQVTRQHPAPPRPAHVKTKKNQNLMDRHGAKTDDNGPSRYHPASDPNPDKLFYSGGTSAPHFGALAAGSGRSLHGRGMCRDPGGSEDTDAHAHPKRCCSLSPACAQQASR